MAHARANGRLLADFAFNFGPCKAAQIFSWLKSQICDGRVGPVADGEKGLAMNDYCEPPNQADGKDEEGLPQDATGSGSNESSEDDQPSIGDPWQKLKHIQGVVSAASFYAALGLHPIRVWGLNQDLNCECGKCPSDGRSRGKHPVAGNWNTLPLEIEELEFVLRANPDSNLGLRTGIQPDGRQLVVIDFDGGPELIAAFEAKYGMLPRTLTAKTGSGGRHKYFWVPLGYEIRNSQSKIFPKVDIRGIGGQAIAPPSRHLSGNHYELIDVCEPAMLPQSLAKAIEDQSNQPAKAAATKKKSVPQKRKKKARPKDIPQKPAANNEVFEDARDWMLKQPPAISGQGGHDATWRVARKLAQDFDLGYAQTIDLLLEFNERCQPPWADEELRHKADDAHTKARFSNPVRPSIEITTALYEVVELAAGILGQDADIFQRNGRLVQVVRVAKNEADASQLEGTPIIRLVSRATLTERLANLGDWKKFDARARSLVPAIPTPLIVEALLDRGQWRGVRPLVGISETPTFRQNGLVMQTPGYDSGTGYLYLPSCEFPEVPDAPTQADAQAAASELREVWAEFEWRSESDLAVMPGLVLTILAKPGLGDVPAFATDSPTPGGGKGLSNDAAMVIGTGRPASKQTYAADPIELEKILGSYALAGASFVNFDDVSTSIGGSPLCKVITSHGYESFRVLGKSERADLPWNAIITFTGNNLQFVGDITRRMCVARMVPSVERPELRTGFAHHPLLDWVLENRARFVVAALTILRAWHLAGRPTYNCTLGSFETWATVVPPACIFAGLANPLECCLSLQNGTNVSGEDMAMRTVVKRWNGVAGSQGATISQVLVKLWSQVLIGPQDHLDGLRSALRTLAPPKQNGNPPDALQLSHAFTRRRERVYGPGRLVSKANRDGVQVWRVEMTEDSSQSIGPLAAGVEGVCGGSSKQGQESVIGNDKTYDDTTTDISMAMAGKSPANPSNPRGPVADSHQTTTTHDHLHFGEESEPLLSTDDGPNSSIRSEAERERLRQEHLQRVKAAETIGLSAQIALEELKNMPGPLKNREVDGAEKIRGENALASKIGSDNPTFVCSAPAVRNSKSGGTKSTTTTKSSHSSPNQVPMAVPVKAGKPRTEPAGEIICDHVFTPKDLDEVGQMPLEADELPGSVDESDIYAGDEDDPDEVYEEPLELSNAERRKLVHRTARAMRVPSTPMHNIELTRNSMAQGVATGSTVSDSTIEAVDHRPNGIENPKGRQAHTGKGDTQSLRFATEDEIRTNADIDDDINLDEEMAPLTSNDVEPTKSIHPESEQKPHDRQAKINHDEVNSDQPDASLELTPDERECLENVKKHLRGTRPWALLDDVVDLQAGIHTAELAGSDLVRTESFLPITIPHAKERIRLYRAEIQRQRDSENEPCDVMSIQPNPESLVPNKWWGTERSPGEIKQIRIDLRPSKLKSYLTVEDYKDMLQYWLNEQPRLESFADKALARAVKARIKKLQAIIVEKINQRKSKVAEPQEQVPERTESEEAQAPAAGTHTKTDDEIRSDLVLTEEQKEEILCARRVRPLVEARFAAEQQRAAERVAQSRKHLMALLEFVLSRAPFDSNVELTAEETDRALSGLASSLREDYRRLCLHLPIQERLATHKELMWAIRVIDGAESRLNTPGKTRFE